MALLPHIFQGSSSTECKNSWEAPVLSKDRTLILAETDHPDIAEEGVPSVGADLDLRATQEENEDSLHCGIKLPKGLPATMIHGTCSSKYFTPNAGADSTERIDSPTAMLQSSAVTQWVNPTTYNI